MIPVVTPDQVKAVDDRALESEDLAVIIDRVGTAIAHEVLRILGGTYGRRINVLIGPGLNGADAAAAANKLEVRGLRVNRFSHQSLPSTLPPADITLDGLFGIGLNRPFEVPNPGTTPVVAIDIPTGLDGLSGEAIGSVLRADITLSLMALKPGMLINSGPENVGEVRVLDIGLSPGESLLDVVEDSDVAAWLPTRDRESHKWDHAVLVVAGSPGMTGASHLVCRGAFRMGASYVHLDSAASSDPNVPTEVVASLAGAGVRADTNRFRSLVVGPGLGQGTAAGEFVRTVLGSVPLPAVVDGDGLGALAGHLEVVAHSDVPTVLTPHDGEYRTLMGHRPGADRVLAALDLAKRADSTVLLKGPTTVVMGPAGRGFLCTTGTSRLATAGTGDVLTGMIAGLLAQGVDPLRAAAAAAHIHGLAAQLGPRVGLVASDLPDLVPKVIDGFFTDGD